MPALAVLSMPWIPALCCSSTPACPATKLLGLLPLHSYTSCSGRNNSSLETSRPAARLVNQHAGTPKDRALPHLLCSRATSCGLSRPPMLLLVLFPMTPGAAGDYKKRASLGSAATRYQQTSIHIMKNRLLLRGVVLGTTRRYTISQSQEFSRHKAD